jgi:hypothetical protein
MKRTKSRWSIKRDGETRREYTGEGKQGYRYTRKEYRGDGETTGNMGKVKKQEQYMYRQQGMKIPNKPWIRLKRKQNTERWDNNNR